MSSMRVFKKILCPVDFSDYSSLALRYAVVLAHENDAPLVICHSIPDLSQTISYLQGDYVETVHEALIFNAKEKLDSFIGSMDSVQAIKIIEQGNPTDVILQTARRTACDLIVMGTHGLSGHEKFFTGSVTNKVLHKAALPVLTVCRPTHHFIREDDVRHVEIKKILCALDYDMNSRQVAKLTLQIGRMYQAEITIFHTVPKVHANEWEAQQQWVKDKLMEFVDPTEEDWCTAKFLVGSGHPAEEILKIVSKNQIDLVVLGHHSRKVKEELFLGSVAKKVVTDSICPVLVARSRQDIVGHELTLI
ncbi:universal stress protein [bacterium]|nr:universal stress protein [bacterium]